MIWKPNVTVAAIVNKDGKYLLVEEQTNRGIRFNQPAGHLEPNESIIEGAIRETIEETGYVFVPESLLGVYRWHSQPDNLTFLRFAFAGTVTNYNPDQVLDEGILRAAWFDVNEIRAMSHVHRSPLVMRCIDDHLANKHYPLEVLTHLD